MSSLPKLVELNKNDHADFRITENANIRYAATQHSIALRAVEVSKAATSFPVFFVRNKESGMIGLTAVSSFETGNNLFVIDSQWCANYNPSSLQTYPFFLTSSVKEKNEYVVSFDENSGAFSSEKGERLYQDGEPSHFMKQVMGTLQQDYKNDIDTIQFTKHIQSLGLLKPIEVLVQYEDSTATLNGLITVDEEKLAGLSADDLASLNKSGYLFPLYSMISSTFQFNAMIRAHNQVDGLKKITKINLKVASNN